MNYTHGGDIYTNQVDYDFSVNINPLGMPLGSIAAAHEGIAMCGRYPDYNGTALRSAIADSNCCDADRVVIGNGAAELIYAVCYALKPKRAVTIAPTFQEYAAAVEASGGYMDYYMLTEADDFQVQTEISDYIKAETDIVFLCNPNNPTGKLADKGIIESVIRACSKTDTVLCIDESFLPFVKNSSELTVLNYDAFLEKKQNETCSILVIRSFTKIYGMPGLRLGYIVTNDIELSDRVRGQLQPWNVSIPAQLAGKAALKDREYIEKTLEMTELEKLYLYNGLDNKRIRKVYHGAANFILFYSDEDLYADMYKLGFMLRDCSNMKGLKRGYYRIGVRSHSENQMLVRALKSIEEGV